MPTEPGLRLHGLLEASLANGPGRRAVLWLQGCSLGCPGCFNPETHHSSGGVWRSSAELVETLLDLADIDGVTISGGEPLEQPEGLLELLEGLRRTSELSILLFSGFTRAEIETRPLGKEILERCDALIDGRYVESRRLGADLRGSQNQRLVLLSDRFTAGEFERIPVAEVVIDSEGRVVITGVDPVDLSGLSGF